MTDEGSRGEIEGGLASLGIELGSTRIKACLVGQDPSVVLAVGVHEWHDELVGGFWSYSTDAVRAGDWDRITALAREACALAPRVPEPAEG